jgi:iron complex outermembrane receptor protein
MGIQYELPLGNAGSISPRVDGAYQSSFYSNIDNHPLGKVDGYSVFNARLLWRSSKEDWEASLAVTNLTDKFYYLNKFRQPVGFATGQPAPPRQWAVSIRRNF